MTLLGRLMRFFPTLHLSCILVACGYFLLHLSIPAFLLVLFCIYFLPPLCMRLHQRICPLQEGISDLAQQQYSAWWGSHQIQALFNALPTLEAFLRLMPGVYSGWLRLWGSRIGKNIYWTSNVEMIDRTLMNIGDQVIFGHKVACCAHVINPQGNKLLLYVKSIQIGAHVFIGAGSRLGPGTEIGAHAVLPLLTDLKINQRIDGAEKPCPVGE